MIKHSEIRSLKYSSDQMFDLVADINSYSEFLPWCDKSAIISNNLTDDKNNKIIADLDIGYKSLSYTYRSNVILSKNKEFIKVTHVEGPFKHLINDWKFNEISESKCEISFLIDFEFKSKLFNLLMTEFFDVGFKKMVNTFKDRAEDLYSNQ